VLQVLDLIARHKLVLATGHSALLVLLLAGGARSGRRWHYGDPSDGSAGKHERQSDEGSGPIGAFIEFNTTRSTKARVQD
jgi:hypothetical protein